MTSDSFDRQRFGVLLDAYGADPNRWPADEREWALALLEMDPIARSMCERAARLDAILDLAEDEEPPAALVRRILASAPKDAARRISARRPVQPTRGLAVRARSWRYAAAVAPLAAAAALALWLIQPRDKATPPSEDSLAALGTYETPGDELLEGFEVGVFAADTWLDCPDSILGCLEIEADEAEPLSGSAHPWRKYS